MSFETLNLPAALTRALAAAGYERPTDVQAAAIPPALAGRDLMVASRTGSGKTASFMLPALARVLVAHAERTLAPQGAGTATPSGASQPTQASGAARGPRRPGAARGAWQPGAASGTRPASASCGPRVLVLAPTRELAQQVARAAHDYGRFVPRLAVATVVGGVAYGPQLRALRHAPDIVVATPGRLLDHLEAGKTTLGHVEMLVLDEADRMLDLGFIDDIRRIAAALPAARQTVMYSATFGGDAGALAAELLRAPERIAIASHTAAHADIEQRLHWADDFGHKHALLEHILGERSLEQALVFTSTQRDAEALAAHLADIGHAVEALHGGMPQGRRNRVLQGLRNRRLRVLVATDVAARGIDVPTISHVINFGLPMKEEDYVHRIGRTGRAGRNGLAVTLAERRDFGMIQRIQRYTTQRIPAATIPGLEPRRAEPRPAARPTTGGKPAGKAFGKHAGRMAGKAHGKTMRERTAGAAGAARGPQGRR